MYRGKARHFKVLKNEQGEYAVWYADAGPVPGWEKMGQDGSEDECWDFVAAQEEESGFLVQLSTVFAAPVKNGR